MNDRTHRAHRTTNASQARPDLTEQRAPGTEILRKTLGEDGYRTLGRHRQACGTALGELADLVWDTARETDRLHGKLRRHAAHVRERIDEVLDPRLEPTFAPVTGLLQDTGHTTDLHVARFAQQLSQLALVLEGYQAAVQRTKP